MGGWDGSPPARHALDWLIRIESRQESAAFGLARGARAALAGTRFRQALRRGGATPATPARLTVLLTAWQATSCQGPDTQPDNFLIISGLSWRHFLKLSLLNRPRLVSGRKEPMADAFRVSVESRRGQICEASPRVYGRRQPPSALTCLDEAAN